MRYQSERDIPIYYCILRSASVICELKGVAAAIEEDSTGRAGGWEANFSRRFILPNGTLWWSWYVDCTWKECRSRNYHKFPKIVYLVQCRSTASKRSLIFVKQARMRSRQEALERERERERVPKNILKLTLMSASMSGDCITGAYWVLGLFTSGPILGGGKHLCGIGMAGSSARRLRSSCWTRSGKVLSFVLKK